MDENERLLWLLGRFLNGEPVIPAAWVAQLANGGVSQEEAFALLLGSLLGLDAMGADRAFYARFLRPSVRQLESAAYENDPFLLSIRVPQAQEGGWEFCQRRYAPFEALPCGDFVAQSDGRVLPQIGFFPRGFSYPAALESGREWMSVTPNEIETMRAPIARAHGRVLTFGLGIGYFAFMAASKADVESVTVVEREAAVIRLFTRLLLPQFPCAQKIRIICGDAFHFAQDPQALAPFDFAFTDLWHDVSDGLPAWRRMRALLHRRPQLEAMYWIEDTMRYYE